MQVGDFALKCFGLRCEHWALGRSLRALLLPLLWLLLEPQQTLASEIGALGRLRSLHQDLRRVSEIPSRALELIADPALCAADRVPGEEEKRDSALAALPMVWCALDELERVGPKGGCQQDTLSKFQGGDFRPLLQCIDPILQEKAEVSGRRLLVEEQAFRASFLLNSIEPALLGVRDSSGVLSAKDLLREAIRLQARYDRVRAGLELISGALDRAAGELGESGGPFPLAELKRELLGLKSVRPETEAQLRTAAVELQALHKVGAPVGEALKSRLESLKERWNNESQTWRAGFTKRVENAEWLQNRLVEQIELVLKEGEPVLDAVLAETTARSIAMEGLGAPAEGLPKGARPVLTWDLELDSTAGEPNCSTLRESPKSDLALCTFRARAFLAVPSQIALVTMESGPDVAAQSLNALASIDLGVTIFDVRARLPVPSRGSKILWNSSLESIEVSPRGSAPNIRTQVPRLVDALRRLGLPEEVWAQDIDVRPARDLSKIVISFRPALALKLERPGAAARVAVEFGQEGVRIEADLDDQLRGIRDGLLGGLRGRRFDLLTSGSRSGLLIEDFDVSDGVDHPMAKVVLSREIAPDPLCRDLPMRLGWNRRQVPSVLEAVGPADASQVQMCFRRTVEPILEQALLKSGIEGLDDVVMSWLRLENQAATNDGLTTDLVVRDGAESGAKELGRASLQIGSKQLRVQSCRIEGGSVGCSLESLFAEVVVARARAYLTPVGSQLSDAFLAELRAALTSAEFLGLRLQLREGSLRLEGGADLTKLDLDIADDTGQVVGSMTGVVARPGPELDLSGAAIDAPLLKRLGDELFAHVSPNLERPSPGARSRFRLGPVEIAGNSVSADILADLAPLAGESKLARCSAEFSLAALLPGQQAGSSWELRCEGQELSSMRSVLAAGAEAVLVSQLSEVLDQLPEIPSFQREDLRVEVDGLGTSNVSVRVPMNGRFSFGDDWPELPGKLTVALSANAGVTVKAEPSIGLDDYLRGGVSKVLGALVDAAGGSPIVREPELAEGANGWGIRFGLRFKLPGINREFGTPQGSFAWLDRKGFAAPDKLTLTFPEEIQLGSFFCIYDSTFTIPLNEFDSIAVGTKLTVGAAGPGGAGGTCKTTGDHLVRIGAQLTIRFQPGLEAKLEGGLIVLGQLELARAVGRVSLQGGNEWLTSRVETVGLLAAIVGFNSDLSVFPARGEADAKARLALFGIELSDVNLRARWRPDSPAAMILSGDARVHLVFATLAGGFELPAEEPFKAKAHANGEVNIGGFDLSKLNVHFDQSSACADFSVLELSLGLCVPSIAGLSADEILRRILESLFEFNIDLEKLLSGDWTIRLTGGSGNGGTGGKAGGGKAGEGGDVATRKGDGQAPTAVLKEGPPDLPSGGDGEPILDLPAGTALRRKKLVGRGFGPNGQKFALMFFGYVSNPTNPDQQDLGLVSYVGEGDQAKAQAPWLLQASQSCLKNVRSDIDLLAASTIYWPSTAFVARLPDGRLRLFPLQSSGEGECPAAVELPFSAADLRGQGGNEEVIAYQTRVAAMLSMVGSLWSRDSGALPNLALSSDPGSGDWYKGETCEEESAIPALDLPGILYFDENRVGRILASARKESSAPFWKDIPENLKRLCARYERCLTTVPLAQLSRPEEGWIGGLRGGDPGARRELGELFARIGDVKRAIGQVAGELGALENRREEYERNLAEYLRWLEDQARASDSSKNQVDLFSLDRAARCLEISSMAPLDASGLWDSLTSAAPSQIADTTCGKYLGSRLVSELLASPWRESIWTQSEGSDLVAAFATDLSNTGDWHLALRDLRCDAGGEVERLGGDRAPQAGTIDGALLERRLAPFAFRRLPADEEGRRELLRILLETEDKVWQRYFRVNPLGFLVYP